ncbi:hypothetical protein MATL_G00216560 [Megalops atlanticus]|uniref:GRF-type domain-containing protein n=1 Tax=Megalops atlanticus TaxID=7932 RepID=A0A9D3T3P9_MEGAT|nr:hypothetical protein MATL_G00216560 [Megalops atlanticus]
MWPSSSGFGRPAANRREFGGGGGTAMCNCNEPAVTRTVMKDGPNKGRTFHTCGKPREQQCGFFQWADENEPPAAPGGFGAEGGGAKGRKTGGSTSIKAPAAKRPRTCGLCHQPGHTRNTCPQGQ